MLKKILFIVLIVASISFSIFTLSITVDAKISSRQIRYRDVCCGAGCGKFDYCFYAYFNPKTGKYHLVTKNQEMPIGILSHCKARVGINNNLPVICDADIGKVLSLINNKNQEEV